MRKDCINRELTLEWIVGTFMFLILLGLGYFTIIIGSDNLLRRTYPFEVRFRDVVGLRKGDNVTVQGMTIGKIVELDLNDDWVTVRCALDQPMDLRDDYQIEVVATSVLGGRQLRVHRGSPQNPPLPADQPVTGEQPIDLIAEAGQVVRDVRHALIEGGILEEVSQAVTHLNQVAARLARGEGTIGALLADDQPYRDLVEITGDLRQISGRVNDLVAAIERGEGTIGQLLKDDAVGRHLEAVLADARDLSGRLRAGQGTLGRLLSEDDTLYTDIARTVASLRAVTDKIEQGEGSIGKLVTDDGLHRQITALIDEIRATVDDFRESTPLTTFTSILFGAL